MRLSSRLFTAFAVLAVVVILIMAWATQTLVSALFVDYLNVARPWQATTLGDVITAGYRANGWSGVNESLLGLSTSGNPGSTRPGWHGHGHGMMQGMMQEGNFGSTTLPPLVVADNQGVVRVSTSALKPGTLLEPELIDAGYPLAVDSGRFGVLVFNPGQYASVHPLVRLLGPVLTLGLDRAETPEDAYRAAVSRATWLTGVLALGLAALMGWWVSRRLSGPLSSLAVGADRFARGDLDYTIELEGADSPEVERVAKALNSMATRISEARKRERELFADIAHELRTPLTIMRGQLDTLQEGTAESPERVVLSVQDEILRLSRLVSDLGQLSLAEVGKLPLHKERTSVSALVAPVVEGFQAEAQARGVALDWTTAGVQPDPAESEVEVDPIRIQQVMANLIANALRHTPVGGTVEVTHELAHGEVEFRVTDTGSGIDPETLPHVFDRFYRADASRARETGSTGLGLAIAKGYVEAHGGTITAESRPGEGTTFCFMLPRA